MASQKCPKNVIFKYALGQIAQNSMNFLRPKINVPLPGGHWKMTPACLFSDQSNNGLCSLPQIIGGQVCLPV